MLSHPSSPFGILNERFLGVGELRPLWTFVIWTELKNLSLNIRLQGFVQALASATQQIFRQDALHE